MERSDRCQRTTEVLCVVFFFFNNCELAGFRNRIKILYSANNVKDVKDVNNYQIISY